MAVVEQPQCCWHAACWQQAWLPLFPVYMGYVILAGRQCCWCAAACKYSRPLMAAHRAVVERSSALKHWLEGPAADSPGTGQACSTGTNQPELCRSSALQQASLRCASSTGLRCNQCGALQVSWGAPGVGTLIRVEQHYQGFVRRILLSMKFAISCDQVLQTAGARCELIVCELVKRVQGASQVVGRTQSR